MQLTEREEDILAGKHGKGAQMAMNVLYEMGKLYRAERFIPISAAHIDGCCYSAVWDAGLEFAEKLAELGAKVSVPATLNISARDISAWESLRIPKEFSEKCRRMEQAYIKMGCIPTWSCAPYHCANTPHYGQNVAWSESNAVNYVNSVVGAWTNRYPDLVDICCAVTGLVPEYGLHIKENRKGQILFDIQGLDEAVFSDSSAYAVVGYIVGKQTGSKIPVINGLPKRTSHDDLKALSAASASSGSVALFHAVGITPEAPTLETAFAGTAPEETVILTPERFLEAKAELTCTKDRKVDLVLIGCPHASYTELETVNWLLGTDKVKPGVQFWVQTSETIKTMAKRSGLFELLEDRGVTLIQDSCINNFPVEAWGFRTIVTNSGKMAHYAPGTTGAGVVFAETKDCVKAAIDGEVSI